MRCHHPQTAAQHLTAARARADALVGEVAPGSASTSVRIASLVCVLDEDGRLLGLRSGP